MKVDQQLIDIAVQELKKLFPEEEGRVTAAYTDVGHVLTGVGVQAACHSANLCSETGPICEATKRGEVITAIVSVAWGGAGSRMYFSSPCGVCLERLLIAGTYDSEVVVYHRFEPSGYVVESVRDLVPHHPGLEILDDIHRMGMKRISKPLKQLGDREGTIEVHINFKDHFLNVLRNDLSLRSFYQPTLRHPNNYTRSATLKSITLRQIGLAFEMATGSFLDSFIEKSREKILSMGCNEDDLLVIRNGANSLNNVFGFLIEFIETGKKLHHELPFDPYDTNLLKKGVPMHEYLKRDPYLDQEKSNGKLVRELIRFLRLKDEGGFVPYLWQRGLFNIKIFEEGPRLCPFATMAEDIYFKTADALEESLEQGLLRLEDPSDEEKEAFIAGIF